MSESRTEPLDDVWRSRARRANRGSTISAVAAVVWFVQAAVFTRERNYWLGGADAVVFLAYVSQFVIARRRSRTLAAAEVAWATGQRATGLPARVRARYTRLASLDGQFAARSFGQRAVRAGTAGVFTLDDESLIWAPGGIWSPVGTPFTIDRQRVTGCQIDGDDVLLRLGRTGLLVLETPAAAMVAAWAAGARGQSVRESAVRADSCTD